MKNFNLKSWWKATAIRVVRTMAQAAVASLGTTAMITEIDWRVILSTTAMAGLLSFLNSAITGLPEVSVTEE